MLEIEEFISQTLSQNFSAVLDDSLQVKIEKIDFKNFQSEAEKIKSGRFLYVYTETDRADLCVLLPDSAQKIFSGKLYNSSSGKTEDSALSELLNMIAGNLSYLCCVKENGIEKNVFTFQKPYIMELKERLLWDASECNIFRCSAADAGFYLLLSRELQITADMLFKSDPAFKKNLSAKTLNNKVSEEGICVLHESDIKVRIKNPIEFVIGSSFLPRETHLGKKDVSVVFKEIIAPGQPASQTNQGMIWYRFSVNSGGEEYLFYYTVDVKSREKKYLQYFNSLFKEMAKKTAVFLRRQSGYEGISGKIVTGPDPEDLEDSVILTADIKWENNKIKTRIFVPHQFFSGYLSPFLETWEVESLKKSKIPALITLLSVNSAIFGKNINNFYRQTNLKSSTGETSAIRVSEVLAILDTKNAGRLVQNYFLAGGSSLEDFQSLFRYRYYSEGSETEKIGQDPLFGKEEYKKYIPKALHSDWDLCSGSSADYKEMADLNEKAFKGIYSAILEDRLLMPYKVSFILYNEFQKPLDDRFKVAIKKLADETRWLDLIGNIPKKTGQQLISSTPNSILAAALVSGSPAVKDLAHLISKKKRSELEEELRLNAEKFESGNLSAEKVFTAMNEFLEILNSLSIPEDELV